MENLMSELKDTVSDYEKIHVDGEFSRNRTIEQANKSDEELIEQLLSNERMKKHFFTEAAENYVFDKEKFVEFVNNKQFLEDSYTQFKNKVGLKTGDEYYREKKDVELAWPYKDCVLQGGQTKEDEDRKEKFWNTTLAPDQVDKLLDPKVLTNFKRYTEDGEKEVEEISEDDNLFIRGNNLLALSSIRKNYRNKVDLLYIDPPYNTGSDSFKYNDSFNHSSWLSFMKNRLNQAKSMVKDSGAIFVNIDENEHAYLKVLLDEIFGEENFIASVSWQRAPEGRTVLGQGSSFIVNSTESILVYAKDAENLTEGSNPQKRVVSTEKALDQYNMFFRDEGERSHYKTIEDARGNPIEIYKHEDFEVERIPSDVSKEERIANFGMLCRKAAQQAESTLQQKILSNLDDGVLYSVEYTPQSGKNAGQEVKNFYLDDNIILFLKDYAETDGEEVYRLTDMNDFWSNDEIQVTGISSEGGVDLRRGKKPESLMKRIIELSTEEGDTVLDFFAGSGTTLAVAHKMNRQYIGIEQLDYGDSDPTVRIDNVINGDSTGISDVVGWEGGGDFVYAELMELNCKFLEEIESADSQEEVKKIWEEMKDQAFLSYKVDIGDVDESSSEFESLDLEDQKEFLRETLDKNQLYVNSSEIDDSQYGVSEKVKELNEEFYE